MDCFFSNAWTTWCQVLKFVALLAGSSDAGMFRQLPSWVLTSPITTMLLLMQA